MPMPNESGPRIVEVLASSDRPLSRQDLAKALGLTPNAVTKQLKKLVESGEVAEARKRAPTGAVLYVKRARLARVALGMEVDEGDDVPVATKTSGPVRGQVAVVGAPMSKRAWRIEETFELMAVRGNGDGVELELKDEEGGKLVVLVIG